MEKIDLSAYLSGNEYPGRGICIGVTPDGKQALIGYFIMGRSANSRNRVFAPIEGGIETRAADPAKLEEAKQDFQTIVKKVQELEDAQYLL